VQSKRAALLFLGDPKLDRRIQSFAQMFRECGYATTIYYSIPGGTATHSTSEYVQLPSKHRAGPRLFLGHHMALREKLSEISRADVILACDLYSLRAASQAKARSTKSILIYDARELYTGLPAVVAKPVVRYAWTKCERDGMLQTDLVCVTAPHDADAIFRVHSFLPRPVLIRNIPLRSPQIEPNIQYLRSKGISAEENVVVYVGGLQIDRGLEVAVEAMKQTSSGVKLMLIGTGALDAGLRELAMRHAVSDRVIFAGGLAQEEVLPVLAACDAGLSLIQANSPSYELALPSKIFEYLHAGLPVVSTPLKHVTELFDHQPYMHYVQELSPGNVAGTISKAIESKHPLEEVIAQAAKQYSFEADFDKLRSLLEERLAERR
jgi:glycosyltransferase involved in cell wall biosynthesis